MRLALFVFEDYEAAGGARDFVRFGELDELRSEAEAMILKSGHKSAHIADTETMRVVCWGEGRYERHPLTGHPPMSSVKWTDE